MRRDLAKAFLAIVLLVMVLYLGGAWFPPFVWLAFTLPGVFVAQPIALLLPPSGDDGPAVFASLAIVSAALVWLAVFFIALRAWKSIRRRHVRP